VRRPDPILMIGRRRPRRRPMYQVTSELGRKHLEYLLDQVVLVRGPASAQALPQAVAGIAVAKVYDRGGYIVHAASAMQTAPSLQVIYGFLDMALLIALFGMATTISLSVSERTKEFGLLAAVGATTRQIRLIVRWEAATVVLLGVLLGTGAAVATMALHAVTGSSFLRVDPPLWLLALIIGAAAIITLATSALPARRAARTPILEATKAD
jgi:putative ABC transport system permease protein